MTLFKQALRSETGAVIVVLGIVLLPLVMLIALAIEVGFAVSSREQAQQFARLAALAALEEYQIATCSDPDDDEACHAEKYTTAMNRLRELTLANALISQQGDPLVTGEPFSISDATVMPGSWQTEDAALCQTGESIPCFVPHTPGGPRGVNAMRVTGGFYPSFSTKLASGLFNIQSISLNVLATATISPRWIQFLVDNSRSVVRDTHAVWVPSGDPAASGPATAQEGHEYAYLLASDNGLTRSWHDVSWDWWQAQMPTRVAGDTNPRHHYINDYSAFDVLGDGNYSSATYDKHPNPSESPAYTSAGYRYRVDTYRDASGSGYQGPEPLRTVFAGIREAVTALAARRVNGDRAGVIFYNDKLPWPQVIELTDDLDYIRNLTNFDDATSRQLMTRHGLFPSLNAFTNTPLALAEAYRQLTEANDNGLASKSIVMIGDGLTNCRSCAGDPFSCIAECDNTYSYYRQSMDVVKSMVRTQALSENIPINVILVGDYVGPNTVMMEDPENPGNCLSDSDFRKSTDNISDALSYVAGDPSGSTPESRFNGMSLANPFRQVNKDLYEIAVISQGMWAPLRPIPTGTCTPTTCSAATEGSVQNFDPQCRTTTQQMDAAIDNLMGQTPFLIVEAE